MLQRWTEDRATARAYTVMVALRDATDLPLVALSCDLARAKDGKICVVYVSPSSTSQPDWLQFPEDCQSVPVDLVTRRWVPTSVRCILDEVTPARTRRACAGLARPIGCEGVICWDATSIQWSRARPATWSCCVATTQGETQRVLIPAAGGPNAPRAFGIARALTPDGELTTLYVALESLGPAEVIVGEKRLDMMVQGLRTPTASTCALA